MIGNGSLDNVLTLSKVSQHFETLTVGVKLLPPPLRGFRELSWTRPPVYEVPFHEKIFLDRSNRGGGVI